MTESDKNAAAIHQPLLWIAIGLAVSAMALGTISSGENVLGWDITLGTWIQRWQGNLAESLYRVGDMLGTTWLAAVVTIVWLGLMLVTKQTQIALFLTFVLIGRLLGTQLKPLFDSPRPTTDHLRIIGVFESTGYPSGHSMTVAMVATMLVLVTWHYLDTVQVKQAVAILALLGVILVGWSRVWAGAHWPSDVLGGWSFGISLTLFAWLLSNLLRERVGLTQDKPAKTATG